MSFLQSIKDRMKYGCPCCEGNKSYTLTCPYCGAISPTIKHLHWSAVDCGNCGKKIYLKKVLKSMKTLKKE